MSCMHLLKLIAILWSICTYVSNIKYCQLLVVDFSVSSHNYFFVIILGWT
jgi:hypothetical protein